MTGVRASSTRCPGDQLLAAIEPDFVGQEAEILAPAHLPADAEEPVRIYARVVRFPRSLGELPERNRVLLPRGSYFEALAEVSGAEVVDLALGVGLSVGDHEADRGPRLGSGL